MTKDYNSYLLWGPKWPKNWPSEAHILLTSKSTCNEYVKQYWCATNKPFLIKWPNTRILTYIGAQNWVFEAHIVHISESSSNEHIKQDWCESRGNLLTKYSITWILTHLEAQMAQQFGPLGPIFYTPTKWLQWACTSSFKWIQQKVFKWIDENLYIDLFWGQKGPKDWPTGAIFHTHL